MRARFAVAPGAAFVLERGTATSLDRVEVEDHEGKTTLAHRERDVWVLDACARAPCGLRYRFPLREVARREDDLDVASLEGSLLEAPPATFLLVPRDMNVEGVLRLAVTTPKGLAFVTGLAPSTDEEGTWDVQRAHSARAPYSAFGPVRARALDVAGTRVELAIAEGKLAVTDEALERWVARAGRAVAGYFGAFPLRASLVLLVPGRGAWVGEGRSLAGGGGTVFMRLGDRATEQDLAKDWVLVHEMIHFAFPSVAVEHDWAEEGLATYVEPIARARAGLLTPEQAWLGLVRGLPNGLPRAGDQGLDRTPTWGRTYWGGALFWLLADVGIRRATNGARGLEHALAGLVRAGMTNATRRSLDAALAAADEAAGVSVLQDLHAEMGTHPHPVDLAALFRELGIRRSGETVTFDDGAPLAAVRRAITAPARP